MSPLCGDARNIWRRTSLLIIESDVSGESDWYDRLDAGIAADP